MTARDALAQAEETLLLAHMRRMLHADPEPKTFCPEYVTGPRGWRVANCTRHEGHPPPHVDCHEGTRWT